jgi:membrane glycosyltransferase
MKYWRLFDHPTYKEQSMAIETKPHETHPATHAKAAPKHPMTDKANALLEKIAKADERHREEVKKLREEAADLYAETQAENLTGNNLLVFLAMQTEVDSALNCLDPDCIAKAPPKAPEAAKKAE